MKCGVKRQAPPKKTPPSAAPRPHAPIVGDGQRDIGQQVREPHAHQVLGLHERRAFVAVYAWRRRRCVAPLAVDHRLGRGGRVLGDERRERGPVGQHRLWRPGAVGVHADVGIGREDARGKGLFDVGKVHAGRGGAHEGLAVGGKAGRGGQRERGEVGRIVAAHAIGLVDRFPDDAVAVEVRGGGGGKAAKGGDAGGRAAAVGGRAGRGRVIGVAIVEDPIGAHAHGLHRGEEGVKGAEVVHAWAALNVLPAKVHPRHAKGGGEHCSLTGDCFSGPGYVSAPRVAHAGEGGARHEGGEKEAKHLWLWAAILRRVRALLT